MEMSKARIVAVGEVVWDLLPDRRVLGGAPVNVAYQLSRLGVEVSVITRIGQDALAEETLQHLADLGLSPAGVQRDPEPGHRPSSCQFLGGQ